MNVPSRSGSGVGPLLRCILPAFCSVLTWWVEQRELCGVPQIKSPLQPSNHLTKFLSPNTITLGIRISAYEFWGNADIQTTAGRKFWFSKCLPSYLLERHQFHCWPWTRTNSCLRILGDLIKLNCTETEYCSGKAFIKKLYIFALNPILTLF